jgi:hypothetical protein
MSRRRFVLLAALLVSVNVVLWVAQTGFALPRSLLDRFFGPRMVRAEVVLQNAAGTQDFRIDRGRIVSVSPGSVTLQERDGTVVTIQVGADARVVPGPSVSQLRPRLRVLVVRRANNPAHLIQVEGKG